MTKIEIVSPNKNLVPSYLDFIAEMAAIGEKIWESNVPREHESAESFVARLLRAKASPEPSLVPETTYWAVNNQIVVGRIALRHELNKNLEEFGGHIGYEVRPSARKKGMATEMLKLILETPDAKSIGRLLLTCSPDNVGSNKTIKKNGGAFQRTAYVEKFQRQTNYYWISL